MKRITVLSLFLITNTQAADECITTQPRVSDQQTLLTVGTFVGHCIVNSALNTRRGHVGKLIGLKSCCTTGCAACVAHATGHGNDPKCLAATSLAILAGVEAIERIYFKQKKD
jgi:hypothetical protein